MKAFFIGDNCKLGLISIFRIVDVMFLIIQLKFFCIYCYGSWFQCEMRQV